MVRTSLSLSASTTKWYPSVSSAAVPTVAVVSVVVLISGGPPVAVLLCAFNFDNPRPAPSCPSPVHDRSIRNGYRLPLTGAPLRSGKARGGPAQFGSRDSPRSMHGPSHQEHHDGAQERPGHDCSLSSRRRNILTAAPHLLAPVSRSIPYLPAWVANAGRTIFAGA